MNNEPSDMKPNKLNMEKISRLNIIFRREIRKKKTCKNEKYANKIICSSKVATIQVSKTINEEKTTCNQLQSIL